MQVYAWGARPSNPWKAGGSRVSRLCHALRASPAALPGLSLVAEDAGELIGHVMLSRIGLDCRDGSVDVLRLTPLAVLPGRQGEGVGSRLVREALAAARRTSSYPLVVLEGGPAYYARFGFGMASDLGIERPSELISDGAFQVVPLVEESALPRGRAVYPQLMYDLGAVGP